jgi:hypothetical protein
MKYQEHIKILQRQYFEQFKKLKEDHPNEKGIRLWELLESQYDFNMYSTYDCFRSSLYVYNKKQRECKNQPST